MARIGTTYSLAHNRALGLRCDAGGLFVGGAALLERPSESAGDDGAWRPRPLVDLNLDLSGCYGLPIDFSSKIGGLTAVANALTSGDLVRAQIAALHLRLPDPVRLAKSANSERQIAELARELRTSGILKADWDQAEHPRWPAGSPDSTGGQFAPGGGDPPAEPSDDGAVSSGHAPQSSGDPRRTLHFETILVEPDGGVKGTFFVTPPSKVGGVIVQKIVSTDKVYGTVVNQRVGWEAWPIASGAVATGDRLDDEWTGPRPDPSSPSVATVRTITGEARFYEGITAQDLVEKYGFSKGGSGFSGDLLSTGTDPRLPVEVATSPLTRSRTMLKW